MIDHITVLVTDYNRSKTFYTKALAPLGYRVVMEFGKAAGFGTSPDKPDFWVGGDRPSYWNEAHKAGASPMHFAFTAPTRAAVDAFYQAAREAGGRDNGAPGVRPHYHPNYYAAFVIDPDGNNLEAVCHK